jgi:adenylate kinase
MIILLFGPPGCGKGTQAALIAQRFGIPAISTGDLFRAECQSGSALGRAACATLHAGGLVRDEVVNQLVARRLAQPDCADGFLLDGYPRTLAQARFLDLLLPEDRLPTPIAIHMDIAPELLLSRITARRQCPRCHHIYNLLSEPPKTAGVCDTDGEPLVQRDDDTAEVVRRRLEAYRRNTDPAIVHYGKGNYHVVDASLPPSLVFARIEQLLAPLPPVPVTLPEVALAR